MQHKTRAEHLADHRGNGYPGHAHMKNDHQHQIEHHIHKPGNGKIDQGAPGIPHGPENTGAKVIDHGGRHADKINGEIQAGLVDHVLRAVHQLQHRPGNSQPQRHHQRPGKQRQGKGSMHCAADLIFIPGTLGVGHHHIAAQG